MQGILNYILKEIPNNLTVFKMEGGWERKLRTEKERKKFYYGKERKFRMKYLKKRLKSVIVVVCAFLMVSMVLNIPTYAAYTRKCYLIRNANTTVYSNSGLTWHYGTIYGSDEITVLSVTDRY